MKYHSYYLVNLNEGSFFFKKSGGPWQMGDIFCHFKAKHIFDQRRPGHNLRRYILHRRFVLCAFSLSIQFFRWGCMNTSLHFYRLLFSNILASMSFISYFMISCTSSDLAIILILTHTFVLPFSITLCSVMCRAVVAMG